MKRISLRLIVMIAALTAACAPPIVDTTSLPDGVVGVRYSGQLQAELGTPPYTWKLAEVPAELDWLTLDPETGNLGGIPVAPVFPGMQLTVKVTDHTGRASAKDVTLSVVRGTPKVLASGTGVGGIATNEYAVVWSDNTNRVLYMTSLYGDYTQLLARHFTAAPGTIATNLSDTYWLMDAGTVFAKISNASKGNYYPSIHPIANTLGTRSLLIDANTMFLEENFGLISCPLGDCSTTTQIMYHADAAGAPFAIDETGVYVDNTGEYGAIYHNSTPLVDYMFGGPFAAAAGVLYISNYDGVIYSCPATGCSSTPKPLALGAAKRMKADKNGLYWITDTGVYMCPLPDCPGGARAIAVDQPNPGDLAITKDFVVWANAGVTGTSDTGALMKLAR